MVAERLSKIGNDLGQRIVGDRDVAPQRPHDLVLRDEHSWPGDKQQEQVQTLGRQRYWHPLTEELVAGRIEAEWTKTIGDPGSGHE